MKNIKVEYIDKGTFQASEEDCCNLRLSTGDSFCVITSKKFTDMMSALFTISKFDGDPVWADDRDDAANVMLKIARKAVRGEVDEHVEEKIESIAGRMYTAYCVAVGGKAFNGDPLPDWDTFRNDPSKSKQSLAWIEAAKEALK